MNNPLFIVLLWFLYILEYASTKMICLTATFETVNLFLKREMLDV